MLKRSPRTARLVAAMALSSAFLIVPRFFEHANLTLSRGVLLIDFLQELMMYHFLFFLMKLN
jgi:hypothetical protein